MQKYRPRQNRGPHVNKEKNKREQFGPLEQPIKLHDENSSGPQAEHAQYSSLVNAREAGLKRWLTLQATLRLFHCRMKDS